MTDDWLEQLSQLHQADKAKHRALTEKTRKVPANLASDLLRQSQAYALLRQVQKRLLAGKGELDIVDRAGTYERAISLVWQGPISAARRPNPDDPEPYNYILVGARQGKLWVNGKKVPSATPEALKVALLAACKNPKREK